MNFILGTSEKKKDMIIIVGGDSVEAIKQRMSTEEPKIIEHWSGRRPRDLQRALPKDTEAVVVILDRISHALARKVRLEAGRRGLPISFMGRKWSSRSMAVDLDHQQNAILQNSERGRAQHDV